MSYSQALRRVLSQAKLKYELRVDEADKPFLWITTIKPAEVTADVRGLAKSARSALLGRHSSGASELG